MTPDTKQQLARKFLSVLSHPDADVVKSVAVENVVWSFPGTSSISGEAQGVDGIIARGRAISSYGVKVEILRDVYGYSGLAMLLHNSGDRNGRILDEYLAVVFSFRGDRISRLDTYLSDVAMAEDFFRRCQVVGHRG
jgi:uncharacterized protein